MPFARSIMACRGTKRVAGKTDKGQWPRGLGEMIAILCSVSGELKEAVPIRSLVGMTKDNDL